MHKTFADIETDIRHHYEHRADALLTALNVTYRALTVALPLSEPIAQAEIERARDIVARLIVRRQRELDEVL